MFKRTKAGRTTRRGGGGHWEKDDVNHGQEARKIRPNEGRQEHHGRPRGHRGLIYLRHRGRRLQGGHRQILVSTSTNRRATTTHSPQARLASAHRRERQRAAAVVRASGAQHHHHQVLLLGHHHGGARAPQGGRHHHQRTLEPYYYYPRRQTSPRPADTTKKINKKGVRTLEEDAQARRPTVAPPCTRTDNMRIDGFAGSAYARALPI